MIEVRDLTYTYAHATRPAIEGLDFSVEEGEIFGFSGRVAPASRPPSVC